MANDQRNLAGGRPEREGLDADRRYGAALSALDHIVQEFPYVAETMAAAEAEVARLDRTWRRFLPEPTDGPVRRIVRRLAAEAGRMMPWRRRALLGAAVAAIHRQADLTRALVNSTRLVQSHVVWYAQAVAPYVNSRKGGSLPADGVQLLHAAVNAMAADWLARWESLGAREQRYDARMAALTRAYDELREVASLAQQSTLSLKRMVELLAAAPPAPAGGAVAAAPGPGATIPLDDYKYLTFEDRFRGSREEIRARLADYVPLFAGATNVVDVGCGRGELLDLLREAGVGARGIDLNDEMVATCRERGLEAERADALRWLAGQPDRSLGGLIAIQVVEHLEPPYLMRFLETARHKLRPGAPIVLETVNAACWSAYFDSFIRDFTHARPLHPDTMRYLAQASGFSQVDIQFRSPVDESDKLPSLKLPALNQHTEVGSLLIDVVDAVNAHAEKLNARLFTHRDYAIIGRA